MGLQTFIKKRTVFAIWFIYVAISIGIFFTHDNIVVLATMMALALLMNFFFLWFYISLGKFEEMHDTLATFCIRHPNAGLSAFETSEPFHEIPIEEVTREDLMGLKGMCEIGDDNGE